MPSPQGWVPILPSTSPNSLSRYSPLSFAMTGWNSRRLIFYLARRKIETRYRGSIFGILWALLEPLAMLTIYTFVFSFVFRARWGGLPPGVHGEFAIFLFSGLTIYAVFSESVNESPSSILESTAYVKQLIFPTEVLAWVLVLAGLFRFSINSVLLVAFYRLTMGNLPVSAAFMPLVLLPVVLLALGVTWLLSSLGVFLRDVGQFVGLATTGLLFLSPIFYPASAIPERFQSIYFLNPFAGVLEMSKRSLFEGQPPDPLELGVLVAVGWAVAWAGHSWFQLTKSSFADVL